MLDSDAEGDLAAKQDTLVNALGNKRILRTKDVYQGEVAKVEIEDMNRPNVAEKAGCKDKADTTKKGNIRLCYIAFYV